MSANIPRIFGGTERIICVVSKDWIKTSFISAKGLLKCTNWLNRWTKDWAILFITTVDYLSFGITEIRAEIIPPSI